MTDDVTVRRRKLTEYAPDPRNANKGTERGQYMLDESVQTAGATRSLVASADDVIPIGNHAMQAFVDAGLIEVVEVETGGNVVVVHKRRDWASADDPQVRKAAHLDNRTSQVNLSWDTDRLIEDSRAGVDLSSMFLPDEFDALIDHAMQAAALTYEALDTVPDLGDMEPTRAQHAGHFPLAIVLSAADMRRWAAAKRDVLGYDDDTRAFLALLEMVEGEG